MPDVSLHDPERAWEVWRLLEATGWRWPPDVMLRQDETIMEDLITISWVSNKVKKIANAKR